MFDIRVHEGTQSRRFFHAIPKEAAEKIALILNMYYAENHKVMHHMKAEVIPY